MITVNVNDRAIEITNDAKYENMWLYFENRGGKTRIFKKLGLRFY